MARKSLPRFHEEQRFHQRRLWVLPAILPAGFLLLLIWQVVLGYPVGRQPLSNGNVIGWTIFLWLVYGRLITVKLVTEVGEDKLSISLRGLWTLRRIRLATIGKAQAVVYNPVEDYGGYGIRSNRKGRAYIASGDRGVRLTLPSGAKVLIGSQRPDELARVLTTACRVGLESR